MNFLVDAQLPKKLKNWLINEGYNAIHATDLPKKQFTSDLDIINIAENEERIIVSKDSDFYKYNLIKGVPKRLLIIATGNIINSELLNLFELNFKTIKVYFEEGSNIIEIDNDRITVHS